MSLFHKAENQSAYLKAGFLGFQGSGKTYTACALAIGLHHHVKSKKPVMFLDTETGSDWAIPRFKKEGIELQVCKSRAFIDLLTAIEEAEKAAEILIVDCVSHHWKEVIEAYCRKKGIKGRIAFHHWMPIKQEWNKFSTAFVNSKVHFIVCGRAGWTYDYEEDDQGHKDLIKTGTRMRAEGEFGFEPSLLVEMERTRETGTLEGKPVGKIGAKVLHRAHVLKDRNMAKGTMDGQHFDNPTFETFLPHIDLLNLGGEHVGVDDTRSSTDMFAQDGESYSTNRKLVQICIEEISGLLEQKYPGSKQECKNARGALKKYLFGTYSETKIADMKPDMLDTGLAILSDIFLGDDWEKQVAEIVENEKEHGAAEHEGAAQRFLKQEKEGKQDKLPI